MMSLVLHQCLALDCSLRVMAQYLESRCVDGQHLRTLAYDMDDEI